MKNHLLFLLFNLCIALSIQGADIVGGSINYIALGNQKYKIIGIVNRKCNGPALSIPDFKVSGVSISYPLTATRTSIRNITNKCVDTFTNPCSSPNTQGNGGQEEHIFEAEIDFSIAPYNNFYHYRQCEVIFSMESCCRSQSITNISTGQFYLQAMLNLCVLDSTLENSGEIANSPTYINICQYIPFSYTFNFPDKDIDSILYTLETPQKSKVHSETFISPFTARYPMTPYCVLPGSITCNPLPNAKPPRGLYFNNNTGDIIVTPTAYPENPVLTVRATEYRFRNDTFIKVGYTTKEIFIRVNKCPENNPPFIPTMGSYSICEGQKICFKIISYDNRSLNASTDDTTYLSWNHGIPSTRCTWEILDSSAREKQARFCWQTVKGDARPYEYQFNVTATDPKCYFPSGFSKTFIIKVNQIANPKIAYSTLSGNRLVVTADSDNECPLNYWDWQISVTVTGPVLFKSSKQTDTFNMPDTGRYFIKLLSNNKANCPVMTIDTVYFDGKYTNSLTRTDYPNIHLYPNPSSGIVNIDLNGSETGKINVSNSMGQVLYRSAFTDTDHLTIQLPESVSGPLIVTLQLSNTTVTKKLVIVR